MIKQCLTCNKDFTTCYSSIKRGGGKYCSHSCVPVWNKNKKLSKNHILNLSKSHKGQHSSIATEFKYKNGSGWYTLLHKHVRSTLGMPKKCSLCSRTEKVQWANRTNNYLKDLNDWIPLCYWCHRKYDFVARKIDCLLLAAGLGTRLKPLTNKIPKPLVAINGKPVIRRVIDHLQKYGIFSITVNVHHLSEIIENYLGAEVEYSYEPVLAGTAGAMKLIEKKVRKRLLVVNSDTLSEINLFDLFSSHKESKCKVTVYTKRDAIHTGGIYLFEKSILDYIPSNKFYSIVDDLIPFLIKNNVKINLFNPVNSSYFDIGTPEGLKKAREYYMVENKKIC